MQNASRQVYLSHHYAQCSANWNSSVFAETLLDDKYYGNDKEACKRACKRIIEMLHFADGSRNICSDLVFDYVGNTELLRHSDKATLICHREEEHLFQHQVTAILDAAEEGSVIVSAFVSAKEREVKKMLMERCLPIIEILPFGISPDYHPVGRAYEACAEGLLVQISPWEHFPTRRYRLTRDMCIMMNQLARVIARIPDEWWIDRVM